MSLVASHLSPARKLLFKVMAALLLVAPPAGASLWVGEPGSGGLSAGASYRNGNRRSVTDPQGLTTLYEYDGQNRLKATTTAFGTPSAATTTGGSGVR